MRIDNGGMDPSTLNMQYKCPTTALHTHPKSKTLLNII